jgi:hypothetical protein
MQQSQILALMEQLTGQDCPLSCDVPKDTVKLLSEGAGGLGHSQFNELLLTLGYDRVTHAFFQYLVDGETEYVSGNAIRTLDQLVSGVTRFRKLGLSLYGNVKFAFKRLGSDEQDFLDQLEHVEKRSPDSFHDRHPPIHSIEAIPGEKTYYLGYLIEGELKQRLASDPSDQEAKREEELRLSIVDTGKKNQQSYLVSDHLDVYVATSMRERHEFQMVHQLTHEIFAHERLAELKLRYFDPTQAYCKNRIDKGLAEALMLKRAKCTIYFAQEADTLGKDSELASTLAQGKPVIAFIPDPGPDYAERLLVDLKRTYPKHTERSLILDHLRLVEPKAAWVDASVREWVNSPDTFDIAASKARLQQAIKRHYDGRARVLCEDHPLGIQVNLTNGVANGVLVVRTVAKCAELVRRIMLRELEFEIEDLELDGMKYAYLRETVSGCIFRVVTGDKMLTNAFWNFYLLNPIES